MDEMDVEALDSRLEVWESVEVGLSSFPIVIVQPVIDDVAEGVPVEAVMLFGVLDRVGDDGVF